MPEDFTVSFRYKGQPQEVQCRLRVSAYTYQFLCSTESAEFILEKDDEGNLRALEAEPFSGKKKTDPVLVRAVMEEVEKILQ